MPVGGTVSALHFFFLNNISEKKTKQFAFFWNIWICNREVRKSHLLSLVLECYLIHRELASDV